MARGHICAMDANEANNRFVMNRESAGRQPAAAAFSQQ